jgi:selenocysteine lyase/cysteine desulfurase
MEQKLMEYKTLNENLRKLVCGVDTEIPLNDGEMVTAINFDNAATTPPFVSALEEINNFSPWYSSIHRGTGYKSMLSSTLYENSRAVVSRFVGSDTDYNTVIFVKNTTEAINKLSYRLCNGDKKNTVLSTGMEHHSNDLPWRDKFNIDYVETDGCGRLSLKDLENKLIKYNDDVKLVTITGASNVTGYINPIYEIARLTHKYNAQLLVDAAQLVPHAPVDMKSIDSPEHIDYLVFSAHKMYAPFGIGVLIGPKQNFDIGNPDYVGGGTIQLVTRKYVMWDAPPHKDEAGSPNVMGVAALVGAIKTLNMIGMKNIEQCEKKLTKYTLEKLKKIPDIQLYCNADDKQPQVGIIPFNIKGVHHSITAKILSYEAGIAVRSGCFCAQPYMQKILKVSEEDIGNYVEKRKFPPYGVVRISFGVYNTIEEVDILVDMLMDIIKYKDQYLKKYKSTQEQLYFPNV